jgi:hypothetical protein
MLTDKPTSAANAGMLPMAIIATSANRNRFMPGSPLLLFLVTSLLAIQGEMIACYDILINFGFDPARTQNSVLLFLPANMVKDAPDDCPKLLPSLIRCLLVHGHYLLSLHLHGIIESVYNVTANSLPTA